MNTLLSTLRSGWSGLSARERSALGLAAAVVLTALLWLMMLAPAMKVLRSAPEQHRQLDQQLALQHAQRQEAQGLKSATRMSLADAQAALQASVKTQLGPNSQIVVSADRATVTLKGVSPNALAQWLANARTGAQSKPLEAQLTQQNGAWDGTLQMQLPQREAR